MKKRFLSMLLCVLLGATSIPYTVTAADAAFDTASDTADSTSTDILSVEQLFSAAADRAENFSDADEIPTKVSSESSTAISNEIQTEDQMVTQDTPDEDATGAADTIEDEGDGYYSDSTYDYYLDTETGEVTILQYFGNDKNLVVPGTLTEPTTKKVYPITTIGISSFDKNNKLETLTLPDGITTIMHDSFKQCYNLTTVHLPDSMTTIGEYSFFQCTSLTSINIPTSLTKIEEATFLLCVALEGDLIIPASVKSIDSMAFGSCSSLTSVTMAGANTDISGAHAAFAQCYGLKKMVLPSKTKSIPTFFLSSCGKLDTFTLPSTVTSLEYGCFERCTSLKSMTIPATVTSIGDTTYAPLAEDEEYEPYPRGVFSNGNVNMLEIILYVTRDSYANTYARTYGLTYYYTVVASFNGNGGTGSRSSITSIMNKTITLPTNPYTRKGYTFTGWKSSANNTVYAAGSTYILGVTDVTFTAQWKANTYKVAFSKNNTSATGTMSNLSMTYNTAKALSANQFKLTGYTFARWNTWADGKGTSYANAARVNNLTATNNGTVNLYAQWTANKYKITFYKNNSKATGATSAMSMTYNTGKALTANGFKLSGYSFVGWNTKTNGTGTWYRNKTSVKNLTSANGGSIKLYAQWMKTASISKLSSTSAKKITVSYAKVTKATGYRIRYSTSSAMKNAKIVTTTALKKTLTTTASKKVYYVQVQAYRTVNGTNVYGSWSAKKKVTTK